MPDRLRKNSGLTAVAVHTLALSVVAFFTGAAFADLSVRKIQIAPSALTSRVPEVTAKGRFLAPQAISAVDISADGNFITVGTLAFSHDANVWQLAPDATVMARRYFPPWAPMQVATLPGGRPGRRAGLLARHFARTHGVVRSIRGTVCPNAE